ESRRFAPVTASRAEPMRLPLVVGNWKMNTRPEEASALAQAASELARELAGTAEVGVAPPMIWLGRGRAAGVRPLVAYGQHCRGRRRAARALARARARCGCSAAVRLRPELQRP